MGGVIQVMFAGVKCRVGYGTKIGYSYNVKTGIKSGHFHHILKDSFEIDTIIDDLKCD